MDYKKDLLKRERSRTSLLLGYALYAIAILWIIIRWRTHHPFTTTDWIFIVLMIQNGISQTIYGLGYPMERLFGKAFIEIDDEAIKIKPGVFDKEQQIDWNSIISIAYKPANFILTKKDGTSLTLPLSSLEYSVIQEIKDAIATTAKSKDIPVSMN